MGMITFLLSWLLPYLLIAFFYTRKTRKRIRVLDQDKPNHRITQIERASNRLRTLAVIIALIQITLGYLVYLQDQFAPIFFIPELLYLLPPLFVYLTTWLCYYPAYRRVRESSIIHFLDTNKPIYNIETRSQFILNHIRHDLSIILFPLLLILLWAQLTEHVITPWLTGESSPPNFFSTSPDNLELTTMITLTGAAVVFLLAPLMIRYLWNTTILPPSAARDTLENLCKKNNIRITGILIWQTAGSMINAAVIGFSRHLRYILLTDALLDGLPPKQLEAVMAHEIAHIRRHHIFWLLFAAITTIAFYELIFTLLFTAILSPFVPEIYSVTLINTTQVSHLDWSHYTIINPHTIDLSFFSLPLLPQLSADDLLFTLTTVSTLILWFFTFGYISRRTERQADTFAVQHLTKQQGSSAISDTTTKITSEAAHAMIHALQLVADLNHIPMRKHNWRHGSIAFRQNYLRSIVGRSLTALSIDRQMTRLKILFIFLFILTILGYTFLTI